MSEKNDRDNPREPPPDTRPYLCVPYWTAPLTAGSAWDTGQNRPLPGAVVSYACSSIHTGPYTPGQPLDITVDVRNSGGGNSTAIATVVVYWAVPSVGFAKPTFFAASVVAVPPSRNAPASVPSPTMTATIPATAPAHICLVVVVSHPQDKAGPACDPVNDRHWAQHNLQAVTATVGAPILIPIMAANPFNVAKAFNLRVGPVAEQHARQVAREFETEPIDIQPKLRLLDAHGAAVSEEGERTQTSVRLGPLDQRQFQLMIEVDSEIPANRSAAVEAQLLDRDDRRHLVGSLGVVLHRPEPKSLEDESSDRRHTESRSNAPKAG